MAKFKAISKRALDASIKAILSKAARNLQTANYANLRDSRDSRGRFMRKLTKLQKALKQERGQKPNTGQATGQMLEELGNPKNIKLDVAKRVVYIFGSRIAAVRDRMRWFAGGVTRPVKSEAEANWLNMTLRRLKLGGGVARGKSNILQPARPFLKNPAKWTKWAADEIAHLLATGRRKL